MLHNTLQINGHWIKDWDWSEEPDSSITGNTNPTGAYCYNTQIDDVETPLDFLTNDTAKKYYKERLRYIIARWGYSPDIGMFEHFSEINQIGKRYDYENSDEIQGTGQYEGNEEVFSDWHGEMSWYLKEKLDIPQLLTLSYTTEINEDIDQSFLHGNIDVITVNQYNYYISDVHGFHRNVIPSKIANSGGNNDFDSGEILWGNYNKPLLFSESGAQHLWRCDNFIETRRNIWQNMFWGVAGTFDWEHEILPREFRNLDIYKRVDEFTQGVDLEGGNWHSGMVTLDNQGNWKYKKSFRDDCIRKDELADVVYMRSGDQEKAFGVITNRRANYYTLGEGSCTDDSGIVTAPEHSNPSDPNSELYSILLQNYGSLAPESGNNRLRIRNMALGSLGLPKEYKIKYYSPYDQVNSIKEETRWAPQLTLEFPDMDTLDIILFEVFPMGEGFKSAVNDTTSSEKNIKDLPKDEGQKQEVLIYPNPNNGDFIVSLENPRDVKSISISDNMGKQIYSRFTIIHKNQFNDLALTSGVYIVKVIFEDEVIRKKIITN